MSKKKRPTDSGGSWMDTYGDMVTLLLTFFIMLYSMSNLDAQKWSVFVKSIPSIQNQGSENITINSQMSDTPETDSTGIQPVCAKHVRTSPKKLAFLWLSA